ncbi:MAG: hypothetical protein IRZ07_30970 [Microbispora sp.]|nr:hypothetical protein [Microbispora sp.]
MTKRPEPQVGPAWHELRDGITAKLRPHIQEHLLDQIAVEIVAELVAEPGWRPPLQPAPQVIRTDRRTRYTRALTTREGSDQ